MYNVSVDKREFFAAKLAAGTAKTASKMAAWWPRHAHASMDYLAMGADGFLGDQEKTSRDMVLSIAREWEVKVPSASRGRAGISSGLMAEHAALECELVDVVSLGEGDRVERVVEKLFANAKAHTPRYAHALRGFPEARFSELLREHASLFLDAVTARVDRSTAGVTRCARHMEENAVALATITAEWF